MKKRRYCVLCFFVFLAISQAFTLQQEENIAVDETSFWYGLIDLEEEAVIAKLETIFNQKPISISPKEIGSKADKIIWYKGGPTLWFVSERLVQIRLTSDFKGTFRGIFMDCSPEHIRNLLGDPWVEKGNSLFYNLPWNGGPIRLRFIFIKDKLADAYIYNLNYAYQN